MVGRLLRETVRNSSISFGSDSQFENEFNVKVDCERRVSRSTFDTTRFPSYQGTRSTYQVVEACATRFHNCVPVVLYSLSSFSTLFFPLFRPLAFLQRNYLLPRDYRDRARGENGFSHFPIMQIPFKKKPPLQRASRDRLYR